jgi:hypothetical protein
MLRPFRLSRLALLLMLLGLTAFMAGCASSTPSGKPAPAGRPTFTFFYTDA